LFPFGVRRNGATTDFVSQCSSLSIVGVIGAAIGAALKLQVFGINCNRV
jgi:hypothetical protein